MEIAISIPLDSDGFVRRACPACEREFKWLYTDDEDEATRPDARGYCCPYCAVWAQPDQWFTELQVEYIRQAGLGAASEEVNQIFSQFNRPGSLLKYTPGDRPPTPKELPPEPDDMRRVDFDCHPLDPLKVAEDWDDSIHCLICGFSV
jgi:hypothetical protein